MSVTRLQVTYKSPEVDEELDRKILEFFNTLDFTCIDRAYHPLIWRRDIFFETQEEIEADRKIAKTMEEVVGKRASKRDKEIKLKA